MWVADFWKDLGQSFSLYVHILGIFIPIGLQVGFGKVREFAKNS